ncbi:MAG: hypothetical protein WCD42_01600 [Rhizomicrobium sp.]
MSDPVTISLGGASYDVGSPLTVQQLIDVRVIVFDQNPLKDKKDDGALTGKLMGAVLQHKIDVIAAGLSADYPDKTADALLKTRLTEAEIQAAYAAIIHLSGLRLQDEDKDAPSGEGAPAA